MSVNRTRFELAKLLRISEDNLTLNNGLWDVEKVDLFLNKNIVKDGYFIVNFGYVRGHFICEDLGLVSLKGSPHTVYGNFICSGNLLETLEFGPKHVGFSYICNNNYKLKNLKGLEVINNPIVFDFSYNKLTSLKGYNNFAGLLNVTINCIKEVCDNIDIDKISLYKNPYHYFKKFNYEYN